MVELKLLNKIKYGTPLVPIKLIERFMLCFFRKKKTKKGMRKKE